MNAYGHGQVNCYQCMARDEFYDAMTQKAMMAGAGLGAVIFASYCVFIVGVNKRHAEYGPARYMGLEGALSGAAIGVLAGWSLGRAYKLADRGYAKLTGRRCACSTQLRHTQLRHTQLRHTQLRHTQLRHTQLRQECKPCSLSSKKHKMQQGSKGQGRNENLYMQLKSESDDKLRPAKRGYLEAMIKWKR